MKFLVSSLVFASLLLACGDVREPEPDAHVPTWGDTVDAVAVAYCDGRVRCGFVAAEDWELCRRHNYSHLCELNQTCGLEIDEGAQALADACVADLEEIYPDPSALQECVVLIYGVPNSCYDWIDAEPSADPQGADGGPE